MHLFPWRNKANQVVQALQSNISNLQSELRWTQEQLHYRETELQIRTETLARTSKELVDEMQRNRTAQNEANKIAERLTRLLPQRVVSLRDRLMAACDANGITDENVANLEP